MWSVRHRNRWGVAAKVFRCGCCWSRTTTDRRPARRGLDARASTSSRVATGAGALSPRGRRLRRRAARPRAARSRRLRGVPAAAGPLRRADHRRDRPGRGGRPGRRPRARRRRLHRQAVRLPRAASPASGPSPPAAATRRGTGRRRPSATAGRSAAQIDRRTRTRDARRGARGPDPKEFDLLAFLAEDPGAVAARAGASSRRSGTPHWYGPTKTLDVHVASLRKKLGDPAWIETVRGVGFRLSTGAPPTTHAGADAVTRRLLVSYLSITVFVLLVLEIPLGVRTRTPERRLMSDRRTRRLRARHPARGAAETSGDFAAAERVVRPTSDTGGRVVVVGADGRCSPTPSRRSRRRDFSAGPRSSRALAARWRRHPASRHARRDAAVTSRCRSCTPRPVGAVRVTYPTSFVDAAHPPHLARCSGRRRRRPRHRVPGEPAARAP